MTNTVEAVPVRRAYKFRMRPTSRQHVALAQCLEAHRELYNAALEERREAWRRAKHSIRFKDQSADLPEIRRDRPDVARWGAGSQQATLRRVDRTFQSFFRRVKAGQRAGYPRFRSASRFDSVVWPSPGDACQWIPEHSRVRLQGIGHVKVTTHRRVEGRVKTIQVKREGRRWYLILSCDDVPVTPLSTTGAVVGLDMGVASFLTTSDGEHVDNPCHGAVASDQLARAQQRLARKRRGSANRQKVREIVANRHRKVANQRRDFHHQLARQLVQSYDLIAVEDLALPNMTRSARGTIDEPGTNVAQKAGLNRSILDAGWGQFLSILSGKVAETGRTMVRVNPAHTSQACSECGHVAAGNRVSQAEFRCLACGHRAHADTNAALNILRAGLALQAAA